MSSSRRKFNLKHPVIVDIGCNCRRPKLSSFFSSSSFAKQRRTHKYPKVFSPSTASLTTATTNTSSSFSSFNATSSPSQAVCSPKQSSAAATSTKQAKNNNKKKGVAEESVAVEKESSDPYLDFRDSMLQMIVEKDIYNWDDLRELLHLFLSLNSPCHHHLILQAFAEIWNAVLTGEVTPPHH